MTDHEPKTSTSGVMRRPSIETGLALAAGVLVTAGLPPYLWTGLLVPLGLTLLLAAVLSAERPARTAWFFALSHQSTLLYWLFLLDPSKTIPTRALVPIQAGLTILYVSVFYLGWGAAVGVLRRRLGAPRALVAAPALWVAMEALRSRGEMGFPWCLSGSCFIGTPLVALARTAGEIGVGAGVIFLAALLASCRLPGMGGSRRNAAVTLACGALMVWACLGLGSQVRPQPPGAGADSLLTRPLNVAAIQSNVALADKWETARIDSSKIPYSELTRLAARRGAEFVVWAETALPAYVRYDIPLLNWTRDIVRKGEIHLFTGFPDADRGPDGQVRQYNSSGLFAPDGTLLDRYAKFHLLPIGESMPFQSLLPILGKLDVGQAEWTPGDRPRPMTVSLDEGDFPFSALICFESIFGTLARDAVRQGSRCLLVITNDGWFGMSAGPRQHAALSRLRAVENDVPVVRCANNGISFICDADGRLLDRLDLGRRGWVQAEVELGGASTLYVRFGAWPLAGFLAVWFLLAVWSPWLKGTAQGRSA